MNEIRELLRRVWYFVNRRRIDAALREEMEAHRELMDDPRRFGNTLRLRQQAREVWGWTWLEGLGRDVATSARGLSRHPGFTVTTVASLAFAFLLVSITIAVVNAYLLRALPYGHADRLYHVMYAPPGPWEPRGLSAFDWEAVTDVVEFPILSAGETLQVGRGPDAQAIRALRVTRGFVQGLDVRAQVGRTLHEPDFRADTDRVAMLGHDLWRERFGADASVLNTTIAVENESDGTVESLRIVGVLPAGFYFGRDSGQRVDVLVPASLAGRVYMVRLRQGVAKEAAEARLTAAVRQIAGDLPADWTGVNLEGVHDRYVGPVRTLIAGVTAGSIFVLLIVAINVAVLTVLRTMRRRRELAVRTALGSSRGQTARLLAAESALICGAGLAIGLALAWGALPVLRPFITARLGRPAPGGVDTLRIDGTVFGLVLAGAVLIVMLLSALPLLAGWHRRPGALLGSDRSATSDSVAMRRARGMLLTLQVAGTLMLLAGAGVTLRGVAAMLASDLGFTTSDVVRGRLVLRAQDYSDSQGFWAVRERFAARVAEAMGSPLVFTTWPPFVERPTQTVEADQAEGGGTPREAGAIRIDAPYFRTLGVTIRQGQPFSHTDVAVDTPVAIVSETLARQLWRDGIAVGRQVRTIEPTPDGLRTSGWRTVVGVAADVRQQYLDRDVADIYLPLSPAEAGRFGTFYVRSDGMVATVLPILRQAAREIDARAVIDNVRLLSEENEQLEGARWLARALTVAAAAALLLALVGVYGVMAYAVHQRRRETAIRIALGATAGAIRRMFLGECGVLVTTGLVLGSVGSVALGRYLAGSVPGVTSRPLSVTLAAAFLLTVAATTAAWWPARRASLTDTAHALKE